MVYLRRMNSVKNTLKSHIPATHRMRLLLATIAVALPSFFIFLPSTTIAAACPAQEPNCATTATTSGAAAGAQCTPANGSFFGLESWYAYLTDHFSAQPDGKCGFSANFTKRCGTGQGEVGVNQSWNGITCTQGDVANNKVLGIDQDSLNVFLLIGMAIFDDMLRVAGMVAFIYVLYGGIRYLTSQGEPENTRAALSTIINALIGTAIAVVAAVAVSFIASALGGT